MEKAQKHSDSDCIRLYNYTELDCAGPEAV
jgi:hypothetical protein